MVFCILYVLIIFMKNLVLVRCLLSAFERYNICLNVSSYNFFLAFMFFNAFIVFSQTGEEALTSDNGFRNIKLYTHIDEYQNLITIDSVSNNVYHYDLKGSEKIASVGISKISLKTLDDLIYEIKIVVKPQINLLSEFDYFSSIALFYSDKYGKPKMTIYDEDGELQHKFDDMTIYPDNEDVNFKYLFWRSSIVNLDIVYKAIDLEREVNERSLKAQITEIVFRNRYLYNKTLDDTKSNLTSSKTDGKKIILMIVFGVIVCFITLKLISNIMR